MPATPERLPDILILEYAEALELFIQRDLGAFEKPIVDHYLLSTETSRSWSSTFG